MTALASPWQIQSAFVTGSTGLLGNNLVRLLLSRGVRVRALSRSRQKAERQFAGLPVEIVEGEMTNVSGFAERLDGTEVLFHTAAYFRDNYRGGRHWKQLYETNVRGTENLLAHAYAMGVRRVVHTSSINVLLGPAGQLTDETMRRTTKDADDYSFSKLLSDREVDAFLAQHPDLSACMVLPGWMIGPGDMGPTSSGQVILDFLNRKLPGIPRATFSVVDARDVAEAMWAAALKGRRGERYIVAGRHLSMAELFLALEQISRVSAPKRSVPTPFLYILAAVNELWARLTSESALISLAAVRLMDRERDRTHFDHRKSERELGVRFRPIEETLQDTVAWYRDNGWRGAAREQAPITSRRRPDMMRGCAGAVSNEDTVR
jgi:nucleoside-diphosphate-sugar epimerase